MTFSLLADELQGKPRKPLLSQQDREGIDADRMAGSCQLSLDVVDGQILLSHSHGQIANPVSGGGPLGSVHDVPEESGPLCRVVPELMAENTESPGGVPEAPRNVFGGHGFHKEAAQGLVLAMKGFFGREEEIRLANRCYPISSIETYGSIILQIPIRCQCLEHKMGETPIYRS